MERMRFTCSSGMLQARHGECSNLGSAGQLSLDVQANDTQLRSVGSPLPSKGRGEGEGRDLLRQMTRVALEPLTLVLSPSPRGEATECVSGIKPEMDPPT
jgi:hypothetical protein